MIVTDLKIGRLAAVTGTSAPTIRYYEAIGLLPPAIRQSGGQRVYGDADIRRVTFIRRCRDFGFSVEKVRGLVGLMQDGDRPCQEARDVAQVRLMEVRKQSQELRKLERNLAAFVEHCDQSCTGGVGADCVILEELADNTAMDDFNFTLPNPS